MSDRTSTCGGRGRAVEWRFLAFGPNGEKIELSQTGVVDELVFGDWFHLEQMNETQWWLRIGDARVTVNIEEGGAARVDIERGTYASPRA